MDLGLDGKVALVLAAGGGLGGAVARTLAAEGAQLVCADINEAALERLAEDLPSKGPKHLMVRWDLGRTSEITDNVQAVLQQTGAIDVLVNITGGPPPTPVAGQPPQTWTDHFHSMVLSVIATTDQVLPGMRERGWGRIITSASSGVVEPIRHLGLSNTLRSSLLGWSKTLAGEVGPEGITVNVVVPGRIRTGRIVTLDQAKAEREHATVEAVEKASTDSIPVGRYGHPQEYADAVAFLASERAAYITGSVLRVDGGMISST